MRLLKWLASLIATLLIVGAVWYLNRTDPMGWISGRALSGEVVEAFVSDWTFADEYRLMAVETRPAAPHSVTTICLVSEGNLYVPAHYASRKSWTYYAIAEPRARIKIGDRIYPVTLERITDSVLLESLDRVGRAKATFTGGADAPPVEDVWIFRAKSR